MNYPFLATASKVSIFNHFRASFKFLDFEIGTSEAKYFIVSNLESRRTKRRIEEISNESVKKNWRTFPREEFGWEEEEEEEEAGLLV